MHPQPFTNKSKCFASFNWPLIFVLHLWSRLCIIIQCILNNIYPLKTARLNFSPHSTHQWEVIVCSPQYVKQNNIYLLIIILSTGATLKKKYRCIDWQYAYCIKMKFERVPECTYMSTYWSYKQSRRTSTPESYKYPTHYWLHYTSMHMQEWKDCTTLVMLLVYSHVESVESH